MKFKNQILIILFPFSFFYLPGQEQPELHIGEALHFNYNLSSWKEGRKARLDDFGYDLVRMTEKAAYQGVTRDAEYRMYSRGFGGGMLKQGWIEKKH